MKDADFKNLLQGVREAGSYLRGNKKAAARVNRIDLQSASSPHAAWLADFTPADGQLPAPQAAMLKQVQKQFPAAKAGKRASRNGVLHWFLIDPKLGPLAGPLQ